MSRMDTHESHGPVVERFDTGMSQMDLIDQEALGRVKSHERLVTPAATLDPRDPLNLSRKRKILAVLSLCFFGAMAAAAELILGAMLPVFVIEYAGLDSRNIEQFTRVPLPAGTNPLSLLSYLPGPPIWKVYLLGSLPVLMIGLSNLAMIPVATAIGRRPVILICGVLAVAGCVWSGNSQSLDSHLAARCLQAIGAGTVESLIPFVIADLTFSHERNTWMSLVFGTQGLIIVGLGFATPWVIIKLSWRWLYFITGIGASLFMLAVIAFLPETRWKRTSAEIHGIPRDESNRAYAPRTLKYDLKLFHGDVDWRAGWNVFVSAMHTLYYPQILFITLLNGAMIASSFAAGYTVAEPLLVEPWAWPFSSVTLCLIPILMAAMGTVLVTGKFADMVCNWGAARRPGGKRVPEDQLLNLILPCVGGMTGLFLFGIAGNNPSKYPWPMFLTGLGLMTFGFLGCNTVGAVYVLEVYPEMAGAALLNIASIRYIIAFLLSFRIAEWIIEYGYFKSFLIYAAPMGLFTLMIPFLWYYGPAWKRRFPGRLSPI